MGRKKIRIQPLPDSQIKAKFNKRKSGLIKKAYELGTLCGAQVALIIFSKDGEQVIDRGYNGTTQEIIQRYWDQVVYGDQSRHSPQQVAAFQGQQFQANPDASTQEIAVDPCVQQEVPTDPHMQQNQYMNPLLQQEVPTDPHMQQGQYMNSLLQQEVPTEPHMQQNQYMKQEVPTDPHMQQNQYMKQEVPTDPHMHQGQYMNPLLQQGVPTDSHMQQNQYMNHHRHMNPPLQQEVPTIPHMQQTLYTNPVRQEEIPTDSHVQQGDLYVNPQRQQPMTRNPHVQQGMQNTMGTNFLDISSDYVQNTVEGNQQSYAQGHQTQLENQMNAWYNDPPSEPG